MQVLITTSSFSLTNFSHLEDLKSAGIEIRLNPYSARLTEHQAIELIDPTTVGLIAGLEPLTERVLRSAKSLKVIARVGTGVDNIDLKVAEQLGITVLNTPDAPTSAVAELTIGHILALIRNISHADRQLRGNNWTPLMGSLLATKTVGVVGFGRIGQYVARLLSAFETKVIICDAATTSSEYLNYDIDQLCALSDIVTLHLPHTQSTHHIINKTRLNLMKPGSFLVNISRGGLVNEDALLKALESGHLSGAALDCFEQEPYDGPLTKLNNVQSTSHMGTYARETRNLMEKEASHLLVTELRKRNIIA